jgi:arylsulfatase A-like enzyme
MSVTATRLVALAVACVALASLGGHAGIPGQRPSVLLIVIDTLRADHLGCYGYHRPTSPRLDALARTGVRFANARAPSSWTAPSVASILTGLYPAVHGVERSTSVLAAQVPTMAEAFRAAGYATAAFSSNPVFVSPVMGFGRGFDRFELVNGPPVSRNDALKMIPVDPQFQRFVQVATADRMTDVALSWLAEHDGREAPFFAYVHYIDPHADYFPPAEYSARFGVAPDAPLAGVAQRQLLRSFRAPESAADLATLVGLYDAEVAFTDAHVGRLLDEAAERVRGPLLVVVTADHGEEFGDHGGLGHGIRLWEEQLRVPLILSGAGVPPGQTLDTPASLVSLWPTLAELAGVRGPAHAAGPSLARLVRRAWNLRVGPLFADLDQPSAGMNALHHRAVIDGAWKLIIWNDHTTRLFDLASDPREQHDIAGVEDTRRHTLETRLRTRDIAAMAARERAAPGTSLLTAERRERLKALGYAQ